MMPRELSMDAAGLRSFSLPHVLRLAGEYQHLLGAGCIAFATGLRLEALVEESADDFLLRFTGAGTVDSEEDTAEFAGRWRRALGELAVPSPEMLDGLSITVDFGPLWDICSRRMLMTCPALGTVLAAAVTAFRAPGHSRTDAELAEMACSLCNAVEPGPVGETGCHYAEAMLGLVGGANYVAPGGERLNVQQLLPPEAMLLALAPPQGEAPGPRDCEGEVLKALARTQQMGCNILAGGEEGVGALFALDDGALDRGQTTRLYGLVRVRQMVDAFLQHVGEPVVDNDRLAEMCDEQSAILKDYFGFPAAPYKELVAKALEAGALGADLSWAFGGCPVAIIIAPGRREEIGAMLSQAFPGVAILPVDVEPCGLLSNGGE